MTTPHAPEGGDVARAAEEVRAAGHSLYSQGVGDGHPMCRAYGRDYEEGKQDLRGAIEALIAAARAEAATALRDACGEVERLRGDVANASTAERARLAGLASEEDREMVQHYGYLATEAHRANCSGEACCEAPDRRDANKAEAEALALILARLAAARGEDDLLPACCGEYGVKRMAYCGACPLDEALAAYVGNPAQRRIVLDRLTTLRARLAAVEGERDAAERRGAERALRWAADNRPGTGGLRDLLGAVADNPEDQWAGYVARGLATIFPPPGAEVGRG